MALPCTTLPRKWCGLGAWTERAQNRLHHRQHCLLLLGLQPLHQQHHHRLHHHHRRVHRLLVLLLHCHQWPGPHQRNVEGKKQLGWEVLFFCLH